MLFVNDILRWYLLTENGTSTSDKQNFDGICWEYFQWYLSRYLLVVFVAGKCHIYERQPEYRWYLVGVFSVVFVGVFIAGMRHTYER